MAKITSTTVQPGQITELQEKAIARLPTGQPIEEEGGELSSFADLASKHTCLLYTSPSPRD